MTYRSEKQKEAEMAQNSAVIDRFAEDGSGYHPEAAEEILADIVKVSGEALTRRRKKNLDEGVPDR